MGEARDGYFLPFQAIGDVVRRRLALDGSVEGKDDFLDLALAGALEELRQIEILGPAPLDGRKRAAQHMVERVDGAGALERPEISHLLDDTDDGAIAASIAAKGAGVDCIDIAAF